MEPQALHQKGCATRLFLGGIVLAGIGILFTTVFLAEFAYSPCNKRRHATCMSNLRQLSIAFHMYTEDYDKQFPPFRDWNHRIRPYAKGGDIFRCPSSVRPYYAAFALLEQQPLAKIAEPAETPMLYDSVRTKPSPYDQLLSLPEPERHRGINYVIYVDGPVKGSKNPRIRVQGQRALMALQGEELLQ